MGLLCVLGQLLTAHALVKLALLSLAMIALLSFVQQRGFHLSRSDMALSGAILFGICYLASPYWTITTLPEAPGQAAVLIGLVILGALWCWCLARSVERRSSIPIPLPYTIMAVLLIVVLFGRGLSAPLEWRGDEDAHLARLWALKDAWSTMPWGGLLPLSLLACLAALWNPGRRISSALRWVMVLGSLAALIWAMGHSNDVGQLDYTLRRYPAGMLWIHAVLTWTLRGWERALTSGPQLARLLPILSIVGIVLWSSARVEDHTDESKRSGHLTSVLVALALATVPVLQCYAASIYIELPLILLMLWVCSDADRLFDAHLRDQAIGPAWIALAVIPFIKETALVFCLAAMAYTACLALSLGIKKHLRWGVLFGRYLRLAVVVLLPVAVYLYFRAQGPEVRFPYRFYPPNFVEPALYRIMLASLWEQCGLLLVLGAVGLLYTLRTRPRQAAFCLLVWIGYFLFYCGGASKRVMVDGVSLPGYLGHARFVLYLVPPLLVVAWNAVATLNKTRPALLGWVMAVCVAGNMWMSPLRVDGTRIPGWGDRLLDTQGHHYPYPQLYAWFADHIGAREVSVAVIGRRYGYDFGDRMYADRFGLELDITVHAVEGAAKLQVGEPLMTLDELAAEFGKAARADPQYIVIHQPVWGPRWDDRPTIRGYELVEAIARFGYKLIVYRSKDV